MLSYKCTTDFPVRAGEVQFGLLTSEETRALSTVQVQDTTIYYRGLPNPYGINDHRMGTVDRRLLCGSCCKDVRECQGHVGHIELAFPMYHIGFFDLCFKTLRTVCFTCARLLLTDEERELVGEDEGKARFQSVYNVVKGRKRCPHCTMPQPTYTRQSLSIRTDWPADAVWASEEERAFYTAPFTQRDALSILTHLPPADAALLGFNDFCRPRDLVMQTVLVPPPVARPAIMASEGSRSRGQDDLTHKLQDINKRSIELQAALDGGDWRRAALTPELLERIGRLQFEVFTYMNNSIRGQKQSTQRSGAPTKSLTDRLRGKDGRIRGNLMGKRVDFSARSVITPDAVMDVDQVGIPHRVAMTLTIPERVTSANIEALTRRVANGPADLFGAETVVTSSGVMIHLAHCETREKIRLQFGWIVERYLADDDVVIFNRQPSLHKVGMMGHRVKLMPGSTFRLNLCCANPYNADFDGDEMNLHVPQSPAAIADVATIMMVSRQIISPQANRPVMGIVQDSLLGAFLLSADSVLLTRARACHLLAHARYARAALPPPCLRRPVERWSGKQLLSLLLPPTLTLGDAPRDDELRPDQLLIVGGRLLAGTLRKAQLGTSAGSLVDVLYRTVGDVRTVRWMSDLQRVVNAWLALRGFAVGVSDCVLSARGERRVSERIAAAMGVATELEREKQDAEALIEGAVVRVLSKCLMQTGGIVDEELDEDNAIRKMVQAGSKGNPINLSQICGCVGQQSVEGRRVVAEKGVRTLSCFAHDDTTLAGRGFVQNSYALGLHPHEYFFHAMGGREGLVDTAVKTATTGYIQRRQMKSMEDHKVCYDGTVRNADEAIIDFSYGGDGMDPTRVERVVLPALKHPDDDARFRPWERELVRAWRADVRTCTRDDARVLLPFAPARTAWPPASATPATPAELEDLLRRHLDRFRSRVLRLALLDFFHTDALLARRLDLARADALLETLHEAEAAARVHYGEMVGSIAAQSIGEPCTQLTLNTFHMSGVGNKNVMLGIPRLKELLDQSKNIKTPCNTIRFKGALRHRAAFATYFADTLPLTRLADVVARCELVFDPDLATTVVDADAALVRLNELVGTPAPADCSRFVVRLLLNQPVMKMRRITPPMVRALLRNRLRDRAHVLASETNDLEWIVRLRFRQVRAMLELLDNSREREGLLCHRAVSVMLDTIALSGHMHIAGAHASVVDGEHVVETQGCSLVDLSAAECVDWYRTTSNDVAEVHATLGLEAAVNVLFSELHTTISFDGTYVDPRHIMMIVNTMTRGGYIMPLSRHGINRMDTGPLLRCSFEETTDILCDAACFGERDNGKGVSQNIMTGKLPEIGTGAMHVRVAPTLMHPRETLRVVANATKRVLKSTIRRRVAPVERTTYIEIEHATAAPDHVAIEPPFRPDAEVAAQQPPPPIFGTDDCLAPFVDESAELPVQSYAPPAAFRREYRPSTPTDDD